MQYKKLPQYLIQSLEQMVKVAKATDNYTLKNEQIKRYFAQRAVFKHLNYDLKDIKYLDDRVRKLL